MLSVRVLGNSCFRISVSQAHFDSFFSAGILSQQTHGSDWGEITWRGVGISLTGKFTAGKECLLRRRP